MNEPDITISGANWCPDCRRAKKFLAEQQMEYRWVDIELDPEAVAYVERVNKGKRIIPTPSFSAMDRFWWNRPTLNWPPS